MLHVEQLRQQQIPAMDFTMADQLTSSNVSMTKEHGERIPNVQSMTVITVQCHSFQDIMASLGRDHVDYFSLDVEGKFCLVL
ncbi:hypothetical protein DPMN_034435 [Dreissena polymorpha]|uniref:Uncharacterized protein n=1 Tax=Dreissena polymorpha TaxID=45954 RepID=A0A9D4MA69_DREPO|nr:hypothetical protein DPMN_034435 [Dreissena polymorpha]